MIQNNNAETYMLYILDLGDCWKKDYVNYTKRFYLEYLNSAMKDLALWLSAEPKKTVFVSPICPGRVHQFTILSKFRTRAPPINGQLVLIITTPLIGPQLNAARGIAPSK